VSESSSSKISRLKFAQISEQKIDTKIAGKLPEITSVSNVKREVVPRSLLEGDRIR
jgi:hypothetical protein